MRIIQNLAVIALLQTQAVNVRPKSHEDSLALAQTGVEADMKWFLIDDIYLWMKCKFWNCEFYNKKDEPKKEEPKKEDPKPEPEKPKPEPEKKPETKPNATNKTNTTAPAKPSSSQIDGNDLIAIKKTKVETANSTANATK